MSDAHADAEQMLSKCRANAHICTGYPQGDLGGICTTFGLVLAFAFMSDYQLRLQAAKRGEIKYLGRECHAKHGGIRYTSNGVCVECMKEKAKTRIDAIRDELKKNSTPA